MSNVSEAALKSLYWVQRIQGITGNAFRISLQCDWQFDNGYFDKPIKARTQILVHILGPRTKISALFHRLESEFQFRLGRRLILYFIQSLIGRSAGLL